MNDQWFPDAIQSLGPDWKQGYTFYRGYMNEHLGKGAVLHSMEGSYLGALSVLHSDRQASWTFSVRKRGLPVQHYPINSITWHCGRYGDDVGIYAGNASLLGIEVEGAKNEPLTPNQILWLQDILQWYWRIKRLGPPSRPEAWQTYPTTSTPYIKDDELWEHNEISATDCPSGRIPWDTIIKGVMVAEQPTEWEQYTHLLTIELQYFERVRALADDILTSERRLIAVWRRSSADPPMDHCVFQDVRALCSQMKAAITDLEGRCRIAGRG